MVRHTQTMRRQQPTNCLSVFDHFVGLALKRLLCMILLFTCKCFIYDMHGKRTAQKMKFFIMDFFSKCEQIRNFLRICSHLLKKPLMENFIFCAVACDLGLYGEKNHVFHDRGGIFMGEKVTIKSIEILSP